MLVASLIIPSVAQILTLEVPPMPPFGPRIQYVLNGGKDPNCFGPIFMIVVFGPVLLGAAIVTAPIWTVATLAFLSSHPAISAAAFWAVVKAIARKENAVEAGAKAGLEAGAVALIEECVKKYFKFIPATW